MSDTLEQVAWIVHEARDEFRLWEKDDLGTGDKIQELAEKVHKSITEVLAGDEIEVPGDGCMECYDFVTACLQEGLNAQLRERLWEDSE